MGTRTEETSERARDIVFNTIETYNFSELYELPKIYSLRGKIKRRRNKT
jgi:hypothetical protein